MLHIVKSASALGTLLPLVAKGDQLLLVEDAVYLANPKHQHYAQIQPFDVSVLKEDLAARGIEARVSSNIVVVDFSGFVELTEAHPQSTTWD